MKSKWITISAIAVLLLAGCGGDGNSTNTSSDSDQISVEVPLTKSLTEGTSVVLALPNENGKYTFAITGGEDADKFSIDPQSGELKFNSVPDYENPEDSNKDNQYSLEITVHDDKGHSLTKTLTVTVNDDSSDNGPVFITDNHTSLQENTLLNFTVQASNAVKYKIVGGDDKNLFTIDNSGKLEFLNFIPDYEHSSDKDHNNQYLFTIQATDDNNYNSTQNFVLTITDDSNETTSTNRYVFKTGQNDGPAPSGKPFGDERNFTLETTNNDRMIKAGERIWEDSSHSKNTPMTYNDALRYCNQLFYGGHDDWRLPIRHELYEIINYGKNPTIDDIFQNKTNGAYWTSQRLVNYNNQTIENTAFVISFARAEVYPKDMGMTAYVRCVRGPEYTNPPVITKNDQGTYIDTTTGLEWGKDAADSTWQTAKTRCEDLNLSNKSDWRLPNINELHTIMPIYNEQFLLDSDGQHSEYGDLRGPFWASTEVVNSPNKAIKIENYWEEDWAVDEADKDATKTVIGRDVLNDGTQPKTDPYIGSICVRGGHL